MFPIGIGPNYDSGELKVLGQHGHQDNSLHLNNWDQLRMLLTLDHSFIDRMCRGIELKYTRTHKPTCALLLCKRNCTEGKKNQKNAFVLQLDHLEFVLTTTELRER